MADVADETAEPTGAIGHVTHVLAERYERLEQSRRVGPLVAIGKRFFEIEGLTHGGLLAIELFTTVLPLMIIGFSYFSGFARNASIGDLFIRQLGLEHPLDDTVRSLFGTSDGLQSTWTFFGVASFLFWGIPMSITVSAMFGQAWRREAFGIGTRLWRGAVWFVLYLTMMVGRDRLVAAGDHGGIGRVILLLVSLIPVWVFWSVSPVLLVRDGGVARRSLAYAGLAGVVIDGVILPLASRIVFPILLKGWTGFGPIGVAMTIMTWCGVLGIGWVVTACAGAVIWERDASAETVIETQTVGVIAGS